MAEPVVQVLQSAAFSRAYKKLHKNQKADVDVAVDAIVKSPDLGEPNRGDLAGVYVYKFKSQNQLMLLAYEYDLKTRMLLLLGSHENFYRNLKR
ncbi:Type II bacterial toxin-antitoxin system, ParE-like toxin [Oxalobacteraceae bacterium]